MRTWTYDEERGDVSLDGKVVISESDYTDDSFYDDDWPAIYRFIVDACNEAEKDDLVISPTDLVTKKLLVSFDRLSDTIDERRARIFDT